jgi:endonuclease YncB( thermonuclease family)
VSDVLTLSAASGTHGERTALQAHLGVIMRTLSVAAAGVGFCLVLSGVVDVPGAASPRPGSGPGIAGGGGAAVVSAAADGVLDGHQRAPDLAGAVATGSSQGAAPATSAAARDDGGWIERDFARVTVLDGRTLSTGAVTLRLAGLELPRSDEVCRTLDNRLEQCTARAATQLELLTRSRTLACRYRMVTSSEAVGACRIAGHDLAQRMVRTGYAQRAEGEAAIMLAGATAN